MKKRSFFASIMCIVISAVTALQAHGQQLSGTPGFTSSPISVRSANPAIVSLTPGAEAKVIVTGSGLDKISGATVVQNSVQVSTISAHLGPAVNNTRQILIQAGPRAAAGAYQLRFFAGKAALDVPANIARIEVTVPRQLGNKQTMPVGATNTGTMPKAQAGDANAMQRQLESAREQSEAAYQQSQQASGDNSSQTGQQSTGSGSYGSSTPSSSPLPNDRD